MIEIQKEFTKLRNALNEREEQLLLEVENIYKNNYFDDNIIKESEKLSGKIKKCLESTNILKEKNELNFEINYYIEFENNLNDIEEINTKININCNKNKIKITFEVNNKELENSIKKFGRINQNNFNDIDYEKINEMCDELEDEYAISELIDEETAKEKIKELGCDIIYSI